MGPTEPHLRGRIKGQQTNGASYGEIESRMKEGMSSRRQQIVNAGRFVNGR